MTQTPAEPHHAEPRNTKKRVALISIVVVLVVGAITGIGYAVYQHAGNKTQASQVQTISVEQLTPEDGVGVPATNTNTKNESMQNAVASKPVQDGIKKVLDGMGTSFVRADVQYDTLAVYLNVPSNTDGQEAQRIADGAAGKLSEYTKAHAADLHASGKTAGKVMVVSDNDGDAAGYGDAIMRATADFTF